MNANNVIAAVLLLVTSGAAGCSSRTSESNGVAGQGRDASMVATDAAKSPSADPDVEFVRSVCVRSFEGSTNVPQGEQQAFCDCVRDRVSLQLTAKHRASLQEARGYLALERAPPEDLFERSGLKSLVVASQDACVSQLWAEPPSISANDHERFAELANMSVKEFDSSLDRACPDRVPVAELKSCLKAAAKSWMESHAGQYEAVPDYYITGNDLAREFLDN